MPAQRKEVLCPKKTVRSTRKRYSLKSDDLEEKRLRYSKYLKLYRRLIREKRNKSDPMYYVEEFMQLKTLSPGFSKKFDDQFKILVRLSTINETTLNPLNFKPVSFKNFCFQSQIVNQETNIQLKKELQRKGCKIKRDLSVPFNQKKCMICLEVIQESSLVKVYQCHHCYHHNCAMKWRKKSGQCPVCRIDITDEF